MTVVVAHLPTRESAAALRAGVEEARRREEQLVVFDLGDGTDGSAGAAVPADAGVTVRHEQRDPRQPDAAGALLDAATRHAASVIVIGVRHRSPTGKLLFGSLAQQILLDATVPVLAVKP